MPRIYVGASIGISKRSRRRSLIQAAISIIPAGISAFQRGCPYTHAFAVDDRDGATPENGGFAEDRMLVAEATDPVFRLGPWMAKSGGLGGHTPGTPYDVWAIEATQDQHRRWWGALEGFRGIPYDVWGLLGFVTLSKGQDDAGAGRRLFCSESITLALKLAGVPAFNWRLMPANLASPWVLLSSPLFSAPPVYSANA